MRGGLRKLNRSIDTQFHQITPQMAPVVSYPSVFPNANYSEYSIQRFQAGRYIETSDSSDSDDLELMPPPINDEFYRKSVDEILGSDSDEEKFE